MLNDAVVNDVLNTEFKFRDAKFLTTFPDILSAGDVYNWFTGYPPVALCSAQVAAHPGLTPCRESRSFIYGDILKSGEL